MWDEVREKNFPNRVFSTMEVVITQLTAGMANLCSQPAKLISLTALAMDKISFS